MEPGLIQGATIFQLRHFHVANFNSIFLLPLSPVLGPNLRFQAWLANPFNHLG